jgi:Sigma-70, region 4
MTDAGVVMHRLVQAVLRHHLLADDREPSGLSMKFPTHGHVAVKPTGIDIYAAVLKILRAASPEDPYDLLSWGRWELLAPHIQAAATAAHDHSESAAADRAWLRKQLEGLAVARASLDSMPPELRAAFILRDVEGLSDEEIGATLGISAKVVRQRARNGRKAYKRASSN